MEGFVLTKGSSGTLTLNTLVPVGAPPASLHNTSTLTSDSLSAALERTADVAVTSETLLRGTKSVKGDRDSAFIPGPGVGNTTRGGTAVYQVVIRNVSDVAVTNVIVVDTLPIPGDIGIKDPAPRDSGWEPFFAGQFTSNPPAASVQYSTEHNPCREDLSVVRPGCAPANWTSSPPSQPSLRRGHQSGLREPGARPERRHHVHLGDERAGRCAAELDRLELLRLRRHPHRQRLAAGVGRAPEGRASRSSGHPARRRAPRTASPSHRRGPTPTSAPSSPSSCWSAERRCC